VPAPRMHSDEIDTDVELVGRLVTAQFPQWADLPIRAVRSTGTVNALYRLGDDMYVRLPRVRRWAADLKNEQRWLPDLASHLPLAIPEPLGEGSPGQGYPVHWGVYRWLPGETWAPDRISDQRRAATDLAQFVDALWRVDPTGGPPSWRGGPLATRDAPTRTAIESLRGTIDTDAVTEAWECSLRAPAWEGSPVWTHGDLLPPNLLVDRGRLAAVIDFGGVGVGDPACDLIAGWSLFDADARDVYRNALQVDEATWARGRGWALSIALLIIPYYPDTNPDFVAMATRMVDEVLADLRATG
jgi:aminoglycoside phosphotransferase (APT) family kinase protein